MKRIAVILALVAVLAGAGTGIALAVRGGSGLSPAEARAQVAVLERDWRAHLRAGARRDPTQRFPSPPRSWLERQLGYASVLCDCFTVVEVKFLHPLQAAPLVVLEAKDERTFFARHSAILNLIDKYPPARDNRDWAYEGFLLEARNDAGVPFLAADVFIRDGAGGSFWSPEFLSPPTQP